MAVLEEPLLKTSVSVPTAVFCVPVVLSKSAAAPTAVLESAAVEDQRSSADTSIETAGGIRKRANANQVLYFQRRWSED